VKTNVLDRGEPPQMERRTHDRSLRESVQDGTAHAVMLGAGENYLGPFGIFLGATTLQIGLLATIPQLVGAAMQWAGARAIELAASRRSVIVRTVLAQSSVWVLMGLLPLVMGTGEATVLVLIALAIFYQGTAGLVTPAWNSLIGDLVPDDVRGRFFGRRNRLIGMSTFAALLAAGGVLQLFKDLSRPAGGFLLIFAGAFLARLKSAYHLARYGDPPLVSSPEERFSLWQFVARAPYSNFAKFVFFVATINFAVAFSAPYFALYMLRDLQLSYLEFTVVSAASTISQFLTFSHWGELTDRFGNKKILNICGFGIAAVPLVWLFSARLPYLIVVQLFGGFVWAGFSLASSNYMFDAVSPAKRARCAAYQGVINGVFVVSGSLAGGFVATHLPPALKLGSLVWHPASVLLFVFALSGLGRLIAAVLLLHRFHELRPVEPIRHRDLIFRISHLKPIAGATFSVLTGRSDGDAADPQPSEAARDAGSDGPPAPGPR
jgi:MFS family permease